MTHIYYSGEDGETKIVDIQKDETVLSALLRHGIEVPNGCRNGVCQSCILRSSDGMVPAQAQRGLRGAQKQQGYFLSCCCKPTQSMAVSKSNFLQTVTTRVLSKDMLSDNVLRLRLDKAIDYRPGQYVTLWRDDNTPRSYSLASHPTLDDYLEFHIRVYEDGCFSGWAASDALQVGDELKLQGPIGECFYNVENRHQPLLLAGMGTGLSPLYGILREALAQKHQGKITLLLGGNHIDSFYLSSDLLELQSKHVKLQVVFALCEAEGGGNTMADGVVAGDVMEVAARLFPDCKEVRIFLCGSEGFVHGLRKQCFLSGANMSDISSDAFLKFVA